MAGPGIILLAEIQFQPSFLFSVKISVKVMSPVIASGNYHAKISAEDKRPRRGDRGLGSFSNSLSNYIKKGRIQVIPYRNNSSL